jgi:hypothetical protein
MLAKAEENELYREDFSLRLAEQADRNAQMACRPRHSERQQKEQPGVTAGRAINSK